MPTETKTSAGAYKLAQDIVRKGIPTLRPKGVDGTAELAAMIDAALVELKEAARELHEQYASAIMSEYQTHRNPDPLKDDTEYHALARALAPWEPGQ